MDMLRCPHRDDTLETNDDHWEPYADKPTLRIVSGCGATWSRYGEPVAEPSPSAVQRIRADHGRF